MGVGVGLVFVNSALVRASVLLSPAATSTMPLGSKVAVCLSRASLRLPVAVQLSFANLHSALARTPFIPTPPQPAPCHWAATLPCTQSGQC